MQEEYQMYKIVVIGNSGTGKTNISTRYVRQQFQQVSQATLGVEFLTKIVETKTKKIKISLWDTAGQQKYKALSKVYYKGASGVLAVYDITDAKSYLDLESWMRLVSNQTLNVEDLVIMIVGNKLDLQQERQVPSSRPLQEFQEVYGIDCWQVSAKSGQNIQNLFSDMVGKILQKTSDIKDTVYRGTVEYGSQRGTYIRTQIKQENNVLVPNSSVIMEEEQDINSPKKSKKASSQVMMRPLQGVNGINSIILTVAQHKEQFQEVKQNKKKKKCC